MKEYLVEGRNLSEAYHKTLRILKEKAPITPCPDYDTNQRELSVTFTVSEPLSEPMISKLFIGGFRELEQYRQEILDGILDFEIERGNWAYTYHSRMKEQLPFILRELRRNPYSRRAVIDIRDWRYDSKEGNENPACLQHIHYLIREGALHCKVLFRSNDACKATFMNAFALIMLQQRIAEELGVKMGSYTHRANSYHCYEKDFALLDGYIVRLDAAKESGDVTFDYKDEWEYLMDMAKPEIASAVEELKNR
jgi:thymidylate synthase